MFILNKLLSMLYFYLRPLVKWLLHRFTKLCELQRICYGARAGAERTKQVEISLMHTRNKDIREQMRAFDDGIERCTDSEFTSYTHRVVSTVMREKAIKPAAHPDFSTLFGQCVIQIWGYKKLMAQVEALRSTPYDATNPDHEAKLLQLWKKLKPNVSLSSRVTKQWQAIGFQGDDPKTDFRGMGMLGLENLLFFAKEYNSTARQLLLHSMHPRLGYTFAIVGINLTWMAYRMLKSGVAKTHFFNVTHSTPTMEHFHKFYCYLFFEFDQFWMDSEPQDIMDFSMIHQSFEATIVTALDHDTTVFRSDLLGEVV